MKENKSIKKMFLKKIKYMFHMILYYLDFILNYIFSKKSMMQQRH